MSATVRKGVQSAYRVANQGGRPWFHRVDDFIRRVLDIVLSVLGLVILLPLFAWIAYRIKQDSPGPVFYRGPRAGRGGKPFGILKFRTMYERSESYQGPKVTAKDDDRITPFGHWLRDTKINELPQLWNVLVGDMSLVGPRPEDPDIAIHWPKELFAEVLSVRPGITSPASVLYRNEETLLTSSKVMDSYLQEIMPTKLRLDQLYVRNRNVLADMDVVFWTLVVLLPNLKRLTVPEHLLYRGPLSLFFSRYLGWFIADMLVAFGSIGTAGVIWRLNAPLDLGIWVALGIALVFAVLFSLLNSMRGTNRVDWSRAHTADALELAFHAFLVSLVLFALNLFWMNGPLIPPAMLVVASSFSFIGAVALRYRLRLLTAVASRWITLRGATMSSLGERVVVVGAGALAQFAINLLRSSYQPNAFNMVGILDDDPRKIGTRIEGLPVVGRLHDIPALVRKHDVGLILYAISNIDSQEQSRVFSLCKSTNARVIVIPDILMAFRAQFPADEAERDEMMDKVMENTTQDRETGTNNRHHFLYLAGSELPRARRYRRPLSLIVFTVADAASPEEPVYDPIVLQEVVRRVQGTVRTVDIVGRISASQFAILLPETPLDAARQVAERLGERVCKEPVQMDYGNVHPCLSLGVATAGETTPDVETLLSDAELEQKHAGAV